MNHPFFGFLYLLYMATLTMLAARLIENVGLISLDNFTTNELFLMGASIGLIFVLLVSLLLSRDWLQNEDRSTRLIGLIIIGALAFIVYFSSMTLYTTKIYPNLLNGLGGGKLEPVRLWFDAKDFPFGDSTAVWPDCTSVSDQLVRCDRFAVIYMDDDKLILMNNSGNLDGSWFWLPRSRVAALSGP